MRIALFAILLAAAASTASAQLTAFSGEKAYDHLRILAGEIGPRPMGSPAEQRALQYAVSRFREFGCDEAYVMPMTTAAGVNTMSGIAVGLKKGATGRIIVIGGHIDSGGPDIPGADDDGSGAACVIELARVICNRQNQSTAVFCCWGGEEEGLRGSRYFVDHFNGLDSVDLMLQLDMADGGGPLLVWPGGPYHVNAPKWLTRAAFELAMDTLGYTDIAYYTHAMTLNYAGSGGSGSDHESFLLKGIPAIDFTSDVTFPIHSALDNLRNFTPSGLYRSGDIALKLFERFDRGTPGRRTEKYYLMQFGSTPVVIEYPTLWTCVAISFAIAILALIIAYRRRVRFEKGAKIHWSGFKMILYVILIMAGAFFSENVVGLVRGIRFPWVNNFNGFVALGILGGFIGLWVAMKIADRWRITTDAYVLYLRAFVILSIYTIGFALSGPELALYPVSGLLFMGMAMIVRRPLLKFVLAAFAPFMILHLLFMEDLGLYLRAFAAFEDDSLLVTGAVHAGLIFVFTIVLLPFAYGFVAVCRDARLELRWLERFRSVRGLGYTVLVFALLSGYLSTRPVYGELWQRLVRVEQEYAEGSDSSTVHVRSSEFLTGLDIRYAGKDTIITGKTTGYTPIATKPGPVQWLSVRRNDEPERDTTTSDSTLTTRRDLRLQSAIRPYMVEVKYNGKGLIAASSTWSEGERRGGISGTADARVFSWYSFPDTVLDIPVDLRWKKGSTLTETVTVTYDTLAYPLTVSHLFTIPQYRTVVTSADTLADANPPRPLAR